MTVSGSDRTREKDTRAPARGPFCVFGSSPAGRRASSCRAACCPSRSCLSVWMPAVRRICGKPREISPSLRRPRMAVQQPGVCILYVLTGQFGPPQQRSLYNYMPVLTDSPYPFFTCAGGVPAPLFPFDFYAGDSRQMLEQESLVKYPSLCFVSCGLSRTFLRFL